MEASEVRGGGAREGDGRGNKRRKGKGEERRGIFSAPLQYATDITVKYSSH